MQATGLLCGVAGVRWTSAVISPDLLGLYGLLLSAVQCALVVTHQGFVKHVQRTWSEKESVVAYARAMGGVAIEPTAWLAIAMAAVLLVLHYTGGVPLHAEVFVWLMVVNVGVAVAAILQSALLAEERYWANFAVNALSSVTRSFGPPLLATMVGATLMVVSTAFFLHVLVVVLSGLWFLRHAWHRPLSPLTDSADDLRRSVRSFAGAGLCGWIAAAATRWFGATVMDAEQFGYFVLAGNLAAVVPAALGAILLNYSFPQLFARARAGASAAEMLRLTHRTVGLLMLSSQMGIMVLASLAPWLIGPIIDPRYAQATDWLLAAGGAALAATTTQFYQNVLLARGRHADCLTLSVLSAGLRLAFLTGGSLAGQGAFRVVLIALPWITVALESWYTHRRLLRATSVSEV